MSHLSDIEGRSFVLTGFNYGLRTWVEAGMANLAELSPPARATILGGIVTARDTKNGSPRDIPMTAEVRKALSRLCKDKRPDDYIFVSPKTGSCLQETKRGFQTASRLAGIEGLIWKDLRATFERGWLPTVRMPSPSLIFSDTQRCG